MNSRAVQNIRFWEFVNGDAVKITLKPGQRLEHWQGGPTDEGWYCTSTVWSADCDGSHITREITNDGADCDGRLSTGQDQVAAADRATFIPMYYTPELRRPDWQDVERFQRDYAAEAMGY